MTAARRPPPGRLSWLVEALGGEGARITEVVPDEDYGGDTGAAEWMYGPLKVTAWSLQTCCGPMDPELVVRVELLPADFMRFMEGVTVKVGPRGGLHASAFVRRPLGDSLGWVGFVLTKPSRTERKSVERFLWRWVASELGTM